MAAVPPDAFAFAGPTYLAESPVIDCQRSINLYPSPGIATSKTRLGLVGRPGLQLISNLPTSPVRQLWAGDNRLFAVGGTHFYEVDSSIGVITDYGAMAGSTGIGPIKVVQNGGSAAFSLCVMDYSAAGIFNANNSGPSMDLVFNAADMDYLDGYQIAIAAGASLAGANPNQINTSNFGDVTTWNPLNYVIRTGSSDLTNGLAVNNSLLYIFGQRNLEVWYNAGNAGFPFARVNGGQIGLGNLSTWGIVKFYNAILWLGGDDRGYAQVYMINGTSPQRVSNASIEYLLGQYTGPQLALAWAYGYQEDGHTFYVLNIPTSTAFSAFALNSLVYDLTTGLWHERNYGVPWPCCFASLPDFGLTPDFIGDVGSGNIYYQWLGYTSDNGSNIVYQRTAPHVSADNKAHRYNRFELDCDVGTAAPTLDYSNDGGRSFLGATIPLRQNADAIAPQAFRRFYTLGTGISRDRVFRVNISDAANPIRIANALLDID